MKGWTLEEIEKRHQAGKIASYRVIEKQQQEQPGKRSKYGSKRVEVDGIKFDSKKEAGRYMQLRMMERSGLISGLKLQEPYELNPGGTHSLVYKADFVYTDMITGQQVVEDAKGYRTKEYRKKCRLMLEVHGIKIKEV